MPGWPTAPPPSPFRRKVKKIIAWVANSRDPTDEAAWQKGYGACLDLCFGVYSGAEQDRKPNPLNNKLLQVCRGVGRGGAGGGGAGRGGGSGAGWPWG